MTSATLSILEAGYRCETGAVRDRNEDSCVAITARFGGHFELEPVGLYLVADGMGGHTEGHIASSAASRAFVEFFLSRLYLPLLDGRPRPDEATLVEILEEGVLAAHEAVYRPEPEQNGGSTLTAALVLGRRLYVVHVGDSRAYLDGDGHLRQLTQDHSLVRRLQDQGRLSSEEAQEYQYRNVLLQALGQEVALTVDSCVVDLPASGCLLLCSDGLSGFVSHEAIAGILDRGESPQVLADHLFEAAMDAGGQDNITAIVVRFAA